MGKSEPRGGALAYGINVTENLDPQTELSADLPPQDTPEVNQPAPTGAPAPTLWPLRQLPWAAIASALLAFLVSILAFRQLWNMFVVSTAGRLTDHAAMLGGERGQISIWPTFYAVLEAISIPFLLIVVLGSFALGVLRRRWIVAIQVVLLVGGSNLTTQLLKQNILELPADDPLPAVANSLPSGHTTVAASLAVAVLFTVSRRWRPLAAVLGMTYAVLVGVTTVIGQWHRPSDVIAAYLVVAAWAAIVCVIISLDGREVVIANADASGWESGKPASRAIVTTAAMFVAVALIGALVAIFGYWRTSGLEEPAQSGSDLTLAFVGGAAGIVTVGALVFAGLLAVRSMADRRLDQTTALPES